MNRIETNFNELYIKGEKSGSETVTLTCIDPIEVTYEQFTNDLNGEVNVSITDNFTREVKFNVSYSDLYLAGETYSGLITARSGDDILKIPVIINCSDTLIYTNIPNNVIDFNANEYVIKYDCLPEINKVYAVSDEGKINDVTDRLSNQSISFNYFGIKSYKYIVAENGLSQISTFVNLGESEYIFEKIYESGLPERISAIGGTVDIHFTSTYNGVLFPIDEDLVKMTDGLSIKRYANSTPWTYDVTINVKRNETPNDILHSISITHPITGETLIWTFTQGNASGYVFEPYDPTLSYNYGNFNGTKLLSFRIYSYYGLNFRPVGITESNISLPEGATFDSLEGGDGYRPTVYVKFKPNTTYGDDVEYKTTFTQPESGKTLDWIVKVRPWEYYLKLLSDDHIDIDYKEQIIPITIKSVIIQNGIESTRLPESVDLNGLTLDRDPVSDLDNNTLTYYVKIPQLLNPIVKVYNVTFKSGNKWKCTVNIRQEGLGRYIFSSTTPSPIELNYNAQLYNIQITSMLEEKDFPISVSDITVSDLITVNNLSSDGNGNYILTIHIPENTSFEDITHTVSCKQPISDLELKWELVQMKYLSAEILISGKVNPYSGSDDHVILCKYTESFSYEDFKWYDSHTGKLYDYAGKYEYYIKRVDVEEKPIYTGDVGTYWIKVTDNDNGDWLAIYVPTYHDFTLYCTDIDKYDFSEKTFANSVLISITNIHEKLLTLPKDSSYLFANSSIREINCEFISDNLENVRCMFANTHAFNAIHNIDKWNTSNVINMFGLFSNNKSLENISFIKNWDTSNVTDISFMCAHCENLNYDDIFEYLDLKNVLYANSAFESSAFKTMTKIPKFNFSDKLVSIQAMFNHNVSITDMSNIKLWGANYIRNFDLAFGNIYYTDVNGNPMSGLVIASLPDMSNAENVGGLFIDCEWLTTVPKVNWGYVTLADEAFKNCRSLTNLGGFEGLKCSLDLSSSTKLTHESLMNVINNLDNANSELVLGETNLNKLTDEEKVIAINKGWTLS